MWVQCLLFYVFLNCAVSNCTLPIFANRTYNHCMNVLVTKILQLLLYGDWRALNTRRTIGTFDDLQFALYRKTYTVNESKCYQDTNDVNKNHKGYGIQKYKMYSKVCKNSIGLFLDVHENSVL